MKKTILLSCITVWLLFSICLPIACQTEEGFFVIKKEAPENTTQLWWMKAEQAFKQTSFYRDFNFIIKKEVPTEEKELAMFGVTKLIVYTRPNNTQVGIVLCTDDKEYVKILSLRFSRTDPDYITWVKTLLNDCGITESICGEHYPFNFIQGSVMQNISRSARLDLSDGITSYIVECSKGEENFTVSVRKQVIDIGKYLYPERK